MSNHKNKTRYLIPGWILTIASMLGSDLVIAAELDAEFRAGYITTDNIFLGSIDEVDDFIWTAGTSLKFSEETNRVTTNIRAVLDYLNYDRTFGSDVIGGMDAEIDFSLIDERLSWTFEDNFGQRLFDPLATPNPGNREYVNFFTTGPDLQFPLGDRNFLGIQSRYSLLKYEFSPDDNDRTSARLRLGRRTSEDSSISINAEVEKVKYSSGALSDDFDVNEFFIHYDVASARNIVDFDIGYTQLDLGSNDLDGYLLRLSWTRISSKSHQFLFSGGSQYSTQGDLFRFSQSNGREVGDTVDVDGEDTPFRSHFFYSRYNLERERTRVAIEAEWNQDDYGFQIPTGPNGVLEAFDRDIVQGRVFVERDVSRRISLGLSVRASSRDYKYIDRDDEDISAAATVSFRFSSAMKVYVRFVRAERDSTNTVDSYVENRGIFGISYIPSWSR